MIQALLHRMTGASRLRKLDYRGAPTEFVSHASNICISTCKENVELNRKRGLWKTSGLLIARHDPVRPFSGRGRYAVLTAKMSQVQYTLEWLLPYVRRIQARGNIDYRLFADQLWAQLEKAGISGVCRTSQFHAGSGRTFQV